MPLSSSAVAEVCTATAPIGDRSHLHDAEFTTPQELSPGKVAERANQLEQRIAELRDELAAVQRETVSAASIQRAVALFGPVWDLLLVPERFRILHLLLESVGYDGSTGELELAFYPLGITSLAAEAAMMGQPAEVAGRPREQLDVSRDTHACVS